jgi:hypothetical protein
MIEKRTIMNVSEPRELFGGYDTFTGINRAPAVIGNVSKPTDSRVLFRASVCKRVTEVQKSLTVSGSASISYGPIDVDAKASYVNDLSVTSTSVVVVVYVATVQGTTTYRDVTFDPALHPTQDTLLNFYTQHGDSFVESVTLGAEYWATYVFFATSEKEQTDIATQLNGAAEWGTGTSIDIRISAAISKMITDSKVTSSFSQEALGYAGDLPSADNIIAFAQSFPSLPKAAPAVVAFTTSGYEHAPKAPVDILQPLSRSREQFIDLQDPSSSSSLAGRLAQVGPLANQARTLLNIYDTYYYTVDTKLSNVHKMAEDDVQALRKKAKEVAKDPVTPWEIPEAPSLSYGIPELNVAIRQSRRWGGDGGEAFPGPEEVSQVREQWKLTQLQTRSGIYIDQIKLTWTDPALASRSQRRGGDGGSEHTINLAPDEYVTKVIVRNGSQVDHLMITTSKNQLGNWGGGGGGEQDPVDFAPNGKVFLGFYGRSGGVIDALGVVWAEFSPAIWNKGVLGGETGETRDLEHSRAPGTKTRSSGGPACRT